jgi:hypothetical protein
MKPNEPKKKLTLTERVKLKIDSKTIVIVRSKEALKMWMSRHPGAQVIA